MIRVAVFNDTEPSRHYGCVLVMKNMKKLLANQGMRIVWSWPVGSDWRNYKEKLPKVGEIDLIIVNGEGTIHNSGKRPIVDSLVEVGALAKNTYNLPCFLINATLHKNEKVFYEKMQSNFDAIYVRDKASQDELASFNIKSKVVPDLTLAQKITIEPKEREFYTGIDSVKNDVSLVIRDICKKYGWNYLKMVNKGLRYIFSTYKKNPIFLFKELLHHFKQRKKAFNSPNEFANWLAKNKFIVTGRYHALTIALLTNTPFLAIESNTPKISSLLNECFGNLNRLVPIEELKEKLDMERKTLFEWTEDEIESRKLFIEHAQKANEEMFKEIKSFI